MKKVLFIASTGGHFVELMQLSSMFKKYDYHIIAENNKANANLRKQHPGRVDFPLNISVDKTLHREV